MTQFDLSVANQTFPAFRSDMNSAFPALSSQQSGPSDPPTTVQFQYFADTTDDLLKRRNVGDSAFLPFDTLLDSRVETKVANYTHLLADMNRTILLDATAGDITVDLLDTSVAGNGFRTTFIRIAASSNNVTIDGFGAQTINGDLTKVLLGQFGSLSIVGDTTTWSADHYNSGVGSWLPTYGATGSMTWTSVTTNFANFWIKDDIFHFEMSAVGDTGGVAAVGLTFTLPVGFVPKNDRNNFCGHVGISSLLASNIENPGLLVLNSATQLFVCSVIDETVLRLGAGDGVVAVSGSFALV